MTGAFGEVYAGAYDLLYADKDYAAEVDVVEQAFQSYGLGAIRRVLDLGCGTGRHAAVLVERGYEVVGVDRSAGMLEHARARVPEARFVLGDLTSVNLGETFDAVLLLFAVLGYQTGNADVQAALDAARRHLHPSGLLLFDVWYGPAVLSERPAERVRVINRTDHQEQVIRVASPELDTRFQACTVRYHLWRLGAGRVLEQTSEHHRVRFFFPLELELFLGHAGFELIRLGGFPDIDREATTSTWNVAVVARAV